MSEASVNPRIEASWLQALDDEFRAPYFIQLKQFLVDERSKHTVYPPGNRIFNAFDLTPITKIKIVILGQDPYHGPGQAHGLCFSVSDGVRFPPSLQNIFKELHQDIGMAMPSSGDLSPWARQGVFLLNATLSVRQHQAGSHQGKGWEKFTDAAIRAVSQRCPHVVFMLWGRFAREKKALIDSDRHLILEAAHPSPLSAYNGFFGCRHFSKANSYLEEKGIEPVKWVIE
jgi:uracil-DNA glycosylase